MIDAGKIQHESKAGLQHIQSLLRTVEGLPNLTKQFESLATRLETIYLEACKDGTEATLQSKK